MSGSGTLHYGETTYYAATQDCFLIDCRQEYSHISSRENPWELLWLHFNGPQAHLYFQYVIQKNGYCFHTNHLAAISESIHELIRLNSEVSENSDIISFSSYYRHSDHERYRMPKKSRAQSGNRNEGEAVSDIGLYQ
ncbi:MAG: AraC family ligand binding domain-containing protein [Enterocloster bolteae]